MEKAWKVFNKEFLEKFPGILRYACNIDFWGGNDNKIFVILRYSDELWEKLQEGGFLWLVSEGEDEFFKTITYKASKKVNGIEIVVKVMNFIPKEVKEDEKAKRV